MGDLAAMIMSMDTLQLSGIGLATMGSIGLLTYSVLKKKPSHNPVERASALSDAALRSNKPRLEKNDDESYDINSNEELPHLNTRNNEENQPAKIEDGVADCIESALVYDGYGSKEEASQMLREAMEQQNHQKEKVRLHVIYKNYMAGNEPLSILLERYPTFIKQQTPLNNEQKRLETKEQFDLFATKKDNIAVEQPVEEEFRESNLESKEITEEAKEDDIPVLTEEINFADIKAESDLIDDARAEDEADSVKNFFAEFGHLTQQFQKDNVEGVSSNVSKPIAQVSTSSPGDIHDVWANYMSLYGGRMNLKNTFIHLNHAWGTIPGIAELQEKINHEIGKDVNGNQIPWAIISVLPIKDADK